MINNKIIILAIISLGVSQLAHSAEDDFTFEEDVKVYSPTKLNQSLHDTPASVTVITHKDIKKLGLKNIAEVMRLVPGMAVGVTTGNNYQLAYLNPSIGATRRMQVLIDGMSIYRAGFSRIQWANIPVHINDIEQIEVTRSPSSSAYGSNSFEAVINIITKHPGDNQGTYAEIYGGSINTKEAYIGHGGTLRDTNYHFTISHKENDGYDKRDDGENRRDETDLDSFNLRATTQFENAVFDYQVTAVKGVLTLNNSDPARISNSDQYVEDYSVNLNYDHSLNANHSIKFHLDSVDGKHEEEWTTSYLALLFTDEMRAMHLANPSYASTILAGGMPSGGSAADDQLAQAVFIRAAGMTNPGALDNVVGEINEDLRERRTTFSIEDTYVFSDSVRAVTGIGLDYNELESQTFIGGEASFTKYFAFSNLEYSFSDFVLNAGVMIEKEDEVINDTLVSPRLALNYHLSQNDTFRFIVSKAYRTPDYMEQSRNWNYTMTGITPAIDGTTTEALFYFQASATNTLEPEEILSKEISYYGVFPSIKSSIDVKVFHIDSDNLIAQKLSFFNYNPDNLTNSKRRGGELEFHITPYSYLEATLGYSYLDCEANHQFEDSSLCSRHSGFANTSYKFDNDLTLTAAYYVSDNISGLPYHRTDFVVNKATKVGSTIIDGSLIVRHYSEDHGFTVNETTMIQNIYDDNTHFFAELGVKF